MGSCEESKRCCLSGVVLPSPSADCTQGSSLLPCREGSQARPCVLTGSRPGGGAYEMSQARPGPHWLQAQEVGLMVVTSCRQPGNAEFVNAFVILGISVCCLYDYLSTYYQFLFFFSFYKNLI